MPTSTPPTRSLLAFEEGTLDTGPVADASEPDEADLWFLPGPVDDDPPGQIWAPAPRPAETEAGMLAEWAAAEAGHVGLLARAAFRLGALDERLRRAPEGWHHRLALLEAAEISWIAGDRVPVDRIGLWISLRLAGVQDDALALTRAGWAARRLIGGPGPMAEPGLAGFLGRRDPQLEGEREPLPERAAAWEALISEAAPLHPLTRAGLGYRLWPIAGIGPEGDRLEAAVTAARLAASECRGGALFVPLAKGGAEGLRQAGTASERLAAWLRGAEAGMLAAMRHLDALEAWEARAEAACTTLSGRTPGLLRRALAEWPLLSAPMAEALTGASRAAIQRNMLWFEANGLIREITGQGRFRVWQAAL